MLDIFDKNSYLKFNGDKDYYSLTDDSKQLMDILTSKINKKYNETYNSEYVINIEHDGSHDWFFIGFNSGNETDYFLIHHCELIDDLLPFTENFQIDILNHDVEQSSKKDYYQVISAEDYYKFIESE